MEKEINNLTALREEYKEKAERISEDIDVIKDALGENIDENSEDVLKYECIDGLIFDNVELLGYFVSIPLIKALVPLIILVENFEHVYNFVIWIIRKIPISSE